VSTMSPFEELQEYYPEIIAQMNDPFNAHQFILKLAHIHQGLYIKVLAEYAEDPNPFMIVHGRLAKALHNFGNLVYNQGDASSNDIFGQSNKASVWGKR
jgi:hypothetical protein